MHFTPLNAVKFIQGTDMSFHHPSSPCSLPSSRCVWRPQQEREPEKDHQIPEGGLSAQWQPPTVCDGSCVPVGVLMTGLRPLALLTLYREATCKALGDSPSSLLSSWSRLGVGGRSSGA